jgi:hypothetical protein
VGLQLKGIHPFLSYADDDNLPGVNMDCINNDTETLNDAGKEVDLGINVEKNMYMLVSVHQNPGPDLLQIFAQI